MTVLAEHDYEPVPGLPGPLPAGEFLCWQGRPEWRDLAVSALHIRKVAIYFAVMLAIRFWFQWKEGTSLAEALVPGLALAGLACVALAMLALLAWLMTRASLYTVTNRRIVVRSGITLPVTANLPYNLVASADLRQRSHGYGDIALSMKPGSQTSWIMLWPHVRFWHWGRVQPFLRSLANAQGAAKILGEQLQAYAAQNQAEASEPRVVMDDRSSPTLTAAGTG